LEDDYCLSVNLALKDKQLQYSVDSDEDQVEFRLSTSKDLPSHSRLWSLLFRHFLFLRIRVPPRTLLSVLLTLCIPRGVGNSGCDRHICQSAHKGIARFSSRCPPPGTFPKPCPTASTCSSQSADQRAAGSDFLAKNRPTHTVCSASHERSSRRAPRGPGR